MDVSTTLTTYSSKLLTINKLAEGIFELALLRPIHFHWQAGDYLWLGSNETNLKPFSIANLASESIIRLQIAITPAVAIWWNQIQAAKELVIQGAVRQYTWPNGQQSIVMAAGGTGITPLLALLQENVEQLTQRSVILYWGVREPELLFAKATLNALAAQYPLFQWQAVISQSIPDDAFLIGNLPDVLMEKIQQPVRYQWIICGPWPMVQSLKQWLSASLVDAAAIQ